MNQTRIHLTAARQTAEMIYAELERAFEDDGFPVAILELDEARDLHEVSLYVPAEGLGDAEATMREIASRFEPKLSVEAEEVPDIDWVAHSLEGLKPVRAGRFFVHGSHDRSLRPSSGIAIEIEAGLAFGTGHHGTTAGCLEVIERVVRREKPRSALDLGTGSGVLAIAIAKLAQIPVLATDIDPIATRVAGENVRLNNASRLVHTVTATGFHNPAFSAAGPFDLIVANILARPLMKLAPDMARNLSVGGSLVLSGILDSQRDAVLAAYVGQRFRHVSTLHREGWSTLHLKR
ncbi:50S ribosomal protein L11 methyltransferase [Mesorhizobium sp. BAC0120]|uniref:50S ribosomal protein L11 methyltransferase n=1 Tax=Mesorhizobium sp. BAC0120 TaxID=3090670 RepID=UPI00298C48CF|nr:50S ribosomal protein L11 methyltransferase [Mesorhizobium sp. BAC0120]MDW6020756.1 50S ribosomal protein L11 methyltransferase [Mesorhizobium sp. BAC0120]